MMEQKHEKEENLGGTKLTTSGQDIVTRLVFTGMLRDAFVALVCSASVVVPWPLF